MGKLRTVLARLASAASACLDRLTGRSAKQARLEQRVIAALPGLRDGAHGEELADYDDERLLELLLMAVERERADADRRFFLGLSIMAVVFLLAIGVGTIWRWPGFLGTLAVGGAVTWGLVSQLKRRSREPLLARGIDVVALLSD